MHCGFCKGCSATNTAPQSCGEVLTPVQRYMGVQLHDSQVSLVAASVEATAKTGVFAELFLSGKKAQAAQEVCNRDHKCTEAEQCLIADGSDLPTSI